MQVHSFKSEKTNGLFGFTQDKSGANLSADHGPWKFRNTLTLTEGESRIGLDTDAAITEITSKGVYYSKVEIKVSEG